VGAVLAVMLTLVLARGVQHTLRLLLAGVIVSVVSGALASLITLMRPDVWQGMQGFFQMLWILPKLCKCIFKKEITETYNILNLPLLISLILAIFVQKETEEV
jgi:ABC-type Fe3+-siderophore transport system permease subunit